jgi:hypothetical protein
MPAASGVPAGARRFERRPASYLEEGEAYVDRSRAAEVERLRELER